jgi:hypothetical protein
MLINPRLPRFSLLYIWGRLFAGGGSCSTFRRNPLPSCSGDSATCKNLPVFIGQQYCCVLCSLQHNMLINLRTLPSEHIYIIQFFLSWDRWPWSRRRSCCIATNEASSVLLSHAVKKTPCKTTLQQAVSSSETCVTKLLFILSLSYHHSICYASYSLSFPAGPLMAPTQPSQSSLEQVFDSACWKRTSQLLTVRDINSNSVHISQSLSVSA